VQSIFAFAACGSAAARFMLLISAMKKEQHASDIVLLFNGLTDELLLEEKFVTELESTSSIARRRECIQIWICHPKNLDCSMIVN
jgi:hypothetical protein